MTGTIYRIYDTYGFIRPRKRGRSLHFFGLEDCAAPNSFFELQEGDRVIFVSAFTDKGARAQSVERVLPPPPDLQLPLCETPKLEWRNDPIMLAHEPPLNWRSASSQKNRNRG